MKPKHNQAVPLPKPKLLSMLIRAQLIALVQVYRSMQEEAEQEACTNSLQSQAIYEHEALNSGSEGDKSCE